MTRKKMDGQWQINSYPDKGCRWSRGFLCVECPYDKCLHEYPVPEWSAVVKELAIKLTGGGNA